MDPNNKFRILVSKLVTHYLFDPTILLIILISTITMAVDNPLQDPNGYTATVVNYLDMVYTGIFCLEAIFKIIQAGFMFNGKNSYLRISWNIMDFLIVSFSVRLLLINFYRSSPSL